jgi:hypothetical protein
MLRQHLVRDDVHRELEAARINRYMVQIQACVESVPHSQPLLRAEYKKMAVGQHERHMSRLGACAASRLESFDLTSPSPTRSYKYKEKDDKSLHTTRQGCGKRSRITEEVVAGAWAFV